MLNIAAFFSNWRLINITNNKYYALPTYTFLVLDLVLTLYILRFFIPVMYRKWRKTIVFFFVFTPRALRF